MKRITVTVLCLMMAVLCGCGAITTVSADVTAEPSPTATPTATPVPTSTPIPTPTPVPTPTPTPSPTPAPDPSIWGCLTYGGAEYWVSVSETGANERGRILVTFEIRDFGTVSFVAGEPQYPVLLKLVTEKKTFPWVKVEPLDGKLVCLFNTDIPPVYIAACPADAPDDKERWVYFDPVSLQVTDEASVTTSPVPEP